MNKSRKQLLVLCPYGYGYPECSSDVAKPRGLIKASKPYPKDKSAEQLQLCTHLLAVFAERDLLASHYSFRFLRASFGG